MLYRNIICPLTRTNIDAVGLILSILVINTVVYLQMILSFELPFALIPLLKFTSSKTKMGLYANSIAVIIYELLYIFRKRKIETYDFNYVGQSNYLLTCFVKCCIVSLLCPLFSI